jgi:hypothetical protein
MAVTLIVTRKEIIVGLKDIIDVGLRDVFHNGRVYERGLYIIFGADHIDKITDLLAR